MLAEIFGVDGVIVLIVVVVLLFGGAAIPKLARNLGSAKNEFEKGLSDGKKASQDSTLAASNGTAEAAASPAPTPPAAPVTDDPTPRELTPPTRPAVRPQTGYKGSGRPGVRARELP